MVIINVIYDCLPRWTAYPDLLLTLKLLLLINHHVSSGWTPVIKAKIVLLLDRVSRLALRYLLLENLCMLLLLLSLVLLLMIHSHLVAVMVRLGRLSCRCWRGVRVVHLLHLLSTSAALVGCICASLPVLLLLVINDRRRKTLLLDRLCQLRQEAMMIRSRNLSQMVVHVDDSWTRLLELRLLALSKFSLLLFLICRRV